MKYYTATVITEKNGNTIVFDFAIIKGKSSTRFPPINGVLLENFQEDEILKKIKPNLRKIFQREYKIKGFPMGPFNTIFLYWKKTEQVLDISSWDDARCATTEIFVQNLPQKDSEGIEVGILREINKFFHQRFVINGVEFSESIISEEFLVQSA